MEPVRTAIATLVVGALAGCGTSSTPSPSATPPLSSPSGTAAPEGSEPAASRTPAETTTLSASPALPSPFDDPQSCTNQELGYRVDYPNDWWANERIEPGADDPGFTAITACTFFAPEPIELQPNAGLPSGIAIQFRTVDSLPAINGEILSEETTTVAGREAVVREEQPEPQPGFVPEGSLVYRYAIELGEDRYLLASTDSILQDEAAYDETRPILDAMMSTIEIED